MKFYMINILSLSKTCMLYIEVNHDHSTENDILYHYEAHVLRCNY